MFPHIHPSVHASIQWTKTEHTLGLALGQQEEWMDTALINARWSSPHISEGEGSSVVGAHRAGRHQTMSRRNLSMPPACFYLFVSCWSPDNGAQHSPSWAPLPMGSERFQPAVSKGPGRGQQWGAWVPPSQMRARALEASVTAAKNTFWSLLWYDSLPPISEDQTEGLRWEGACFPLCLAAWRR